MLSACEILKPGCCSSTAWHDCATGPGVQLPAQRSPSRAVEPGLALLGAPAHRGPVLVGPETSAPFVFLPHSCRLPSQRATSAHQTCRQGSGEQDCSPHISKLPV